MFVDWPISHAKCVTEQQAKIKNANHVYVAMRKLQTDKSIEEIYKQHVVSDKTKCKFGKGLQMKIRFVCCFQRSYIYEYHFHLRSLTTFVFYSISATLLYVHPIFYFFVSR